MDRPKLPVTALPDARVQETESPAKATDRSARSRQSVSPFKLTSPCKTCPFLIEGGIRLNPDRTREIAEYFIGDKGAIFSCHSTVEYVGDDDQLSKAGREDSAEQLCAGGLAFAQNVQRESFMVKLGIFLGLYNPGAIRGRDRVFRSLRAMLRKANRWR